MWRFIERALEACSQKPRGEWKIPSHSNSRLVWRSNSQQKQLHTCFYCWGKREQASPLVLRMTILSVRMYVWMHGPIYRKCVTAPISTESPQNYCTQTRACTCVPRFRKRRRRSARMTEVPCCASKRVRFTAIGSQDYSETAIQRKARLVSGAARKKRGFENYDVGRQK